MYHPSEYERVHGFMEGLALPLNLVLEHLIADESFFLRLLIMCGPHIDHIVSHMDRSNRLCH